ncbi:MAG: TlpA family protein disulfide reductase [Armatimonadota bacterium]
MAAYGGQSQQRWGDNTIAAQEMIRDLQLTDQNGRTCHTGPARGKGMLVLSFVSAASDESVAVLNALEILDVGYTPTGKLTVWPIVVGAGDDAAGALISEAGWTCSWLRDRDGYHAMAYGIPSTPCTYLVDKTGVVVRRVLGYRPEALADISARIAAFAEMETPVALA